MSRDAAREAYQRGMDQMGMNQFDPAIASFGLAISRDPGYAEAYLARGVAFARKQSYRQALDDFDMAADLQPDLRDVYVQRASAYRMLGRLLEAAADYSRAIKRYPDNAHYHGTRAEIYKELGRYAYAIDDYTEALRLNAAEIARLVKEAPAAADMSALQRQFALREALAYSGRAECHEATDEWAQAVLDWAEILPMAAPEISTFGAEREALAMAAARNILDTLERNAGLEARLDSELADAAARARELLAED